MSFILPGGIGQLATRIAVSTGPSVWYKFEDTTTTDSSGNGYTGTLIGSPLPTLGTGKFGQGMVFAGPSGGVACPAVACNIATSTSPFSVMAWYSGSAVDTPLFGGRNSSNGNPIIDLAIGSNGVENVGTGKPTIIVRDNGGAGLTYLDGPTAINNSTFHHVAATFDATQKLNLYVDGSLVTGPTTAALTAGITFDTLGCNVGREHLQNWGCVGTIDDFRFYKRALSSTEIASIFSGTG